MAREPVGGRGPTHSRAATRARRGRPLAASAFALGLLAACATPEPTGPAFGEALRANLVRQKTVGADPELPPHPGEVWLRIHRERYVESLVEEPERGASVSRELRELR